MRLRIAASFPCALFVFLAHPGQAANLSAERLLERIDQPLGAGFVRRSVVPLHPLLRQGFAECFIGDCSALFPARRRLLQPFLGVPKGVFIAKPFGSATAWPVKICQREVRSPRIDR